MESLDHNRLLWRPDNLLYLFGGSGLFAAGRSGGLGNAKCVSQPVGIICDDGVSILAIFRLQRALKTKKNPLISGF